MKIRPARISRAKTVAGISLAAAGLVGATFAATGGAGTTGVSATPANPTTPIKHVVVLFPENISFDHYFGTYPFAANDGSGPTFTPKAGTPIPNNYLTSTAASVSDVNPALTANNPNSTKPFRLTPEQAWTCSQNHGYTPEQMAAAGTHTDGTAGMDKFPENTSSSATCALANSAEFSATGLNMGYYDGNTVTAMWNYAQNYAMSDNSWGDQFGPSTVGALNLVSGQTYGALSYTAGSDDENPTQITGAPSATNVYPGFSSIGALNASTGKATVIGDPDPVYDDCSNLDHDQTARPNASNPLVGMDPSNKNIGDLLNAQNVTWGWFQGGFAPTTKWAGSGTYAKCDAISYNAYTQTQIKNNKTNATYDYNPHHNPFQYYKSTSNPHHFPGTSGVAIGANDPTDDNTKTGANHQYDLTVFDKAAQTGNLPAVSFVKPRYSEDGHPNNSDPISEQHFLTKTINELEKSPEWSSTAVIIAYDDTDGWYDHVAPTIKQGSTFTTGDATLTQVTVNKDSSNNPIPDNAAICTTATARVSGASAQEDRCGPSGRQPFLVISPYAKSNYIDHTPISQASIIKFIESNWGLGPIGGGSFDSSAGDISGMFNFSAAPQPNRILLNSDGVVAVDEPTAVPTVTVTQPGQPGQPGATVTVAPTSGPNSVACVKARDKVTLYKAKHKKKLVKKAKRTVTTVCK